MSDSPRVLLCSFDVVPGPTGTSRRILEYLRALQDHFPTDVLSVKTADHTHIERIHGSRLMRVPVGSGDFSSRIQAFERAVRRQLESEEYGLVHFTDPFGGYVLCELQSEHGYRLIYDALSFPSHELRFTHPHLEGDRRFLARVRRQELFCLLNADAIVTGSSVTREFVLGLGVEEETVHVLPTAAELDPSPAPDRRQGTSSLRVAYLGSQVGWQGLPTLLRAVAHAAAHIDIHLTLIGPRHPDWQPQLEAQAAELGITDRVEFHAPVPHAEVGRVLAAADVCALPLDDVERNRSPGGPVAKVAEYLAAGRAIVATDLALTRELLPESCAVFVPPRDAKAMGNAFVQLARGPALRRQCGVAARKTAESLRDATGFRERLRALYSEVHESERSSFSARAKASPQRNDAPDSVKSRSSGAGVEGPQEPYADPEGESTMIASLPEVARPLPSRTTIGAQAPQIFAARPLSRAESPPQPMRRPSLTTSLPPALQRARIPTPTDGEATVVASPETLRAQSFNSEEDEQTAVASPTSSAETSATTVDEPPAADASASSTTSEASPAAEPGAFKTVDGASHATEESDAVEASAETSPASAAAPALVPPPLPRVASSAFPSADATPRAGAPALSPPRLPPPLPRQTRTPAPVLVSDEDLEEITGESEPLQNALSSPSAPPFDEEGFSADELIESAETLGEALPLPTAHPAIGEDEDGIEEVSASSVIPIPTAIHRMEQLLSPAQLDALQNDAPPAPQASEQAAHGEDTDAEAPVVESPAAEHVEPAELDDSSFEESELGRSLPPCSLDPWLAQLLHGYCPPEGIAFDRPPPPTTFPGRDEQPGTSQPPRMTSGSNVN